MIKFLIDNFIIILLLLPLTSLIHELGHAFFGKMFGGKVVEISLGYGPSLFKLGIFNINKFYFFWGYCRVILPDNNRISKFLFHIGGVLFNFLFLFFLYVLRVVFNVHSDYIGNLNIINFVMIMTCLIPINYFDNTPSDGKRLLEIIKKDSA
ncbi:membrane-associated protease RseP (regulator of RpoE activity) [Scopulibacillus daqui]|uniref:Membrane-associated protease RseP (Regulator of RpoE activity) n=1 Tax=Scopulibacillus daqui TaxID=1469162 RepID=A0ABS2Q261_9BACL|nr:site-2 protease family protein [Scopulibacillus daqui]MBM7646206.1 membrane-associated protease RseP (regulator of RpoE activity) [Scopulibacillus daqui]